VFHPQITGMAHEYQLYDIELSNELPGRGTAMKIGGKSPWPTKEMISNRNTATRRFFVNLSSRVG
jgi:hypothetical protein